MKTFTFILVAFILSISLYANAQKATGQSRAYRPASVPLKGYYSIGNNAAKLQGPSGAQPFSGLRAGKMKTLPTVQKGYYATGNNQAKLGEQISFEEVAPSGQTKYRSKPTKGYYSIGRNAEKLK